MCCPSHTLSHSLVSRQKAMLLPLSPTPTRRGISPHTHPTHHTLLRTYPHMTRATRCYRACGSCLLQPGEGFTEVQLVQKMIDGVSEVIKLEEMLAGGASKADVKAEAEKIKAARA